MRKNYPVHTSFELLFTLNSFSFILLIIFNFLPKILGYCIRARGQKNITIKFKILCVHENTITN